MKPYDVIANALFETMPEEGTYTPIDVGAMMCAFRPDADKAEFIELIREWTTDGRGEFAQVSPERLKEGPSYIELGAWLGDQRTALLFIGLGKHHGLWDIVTPATLGITGEVAGQLMGTGMIMPVGFDPKVLEPASTLS